MAMWLTFPTVLRTHVVLQIMERFDKVKKECWESGQCTCGCHVPDLQMANKACEGKCYERIKGKREFLESQRKALGDRHSWYNLQD